MQWVYEKFDDGLEEWETTYRGMTINLDRPDPESSVRATIGDDPKATIRIQYSVTVALAMSGAIRWVDAFWDAQEVSIQETPEILETPGQANSEMVE